MRIAAALAISLVAGCHQSSDDDALPAAAPSPPEAVAGLTADEENFRAGEAIDFDAGGEPRIAWRRSSAAADEIVFAHRTSAWNAIAVSDDSSPANVKSEPLLRTSRGNGRTHVFWSESDGIHYAAVDDSVPPLVAVADTLISTTIPANVSPAALLGAVAAGTLTVAVDRANDNVYAAWAQFVDVDGFGPAAPDEVVVVGVVAGGAGLFGEHFAAVVPDVGATPADVVATANPPIAMAVAPLPAVGSGGTLHLLWVSTTAGGSGRAVRHTSRTGTGSWSGGTNGDVVSDTTAQSYGFLRVLVASDGDVYAAWAQSTLPLSRIEAAYRAVGPSSSFSPSAILSATPVADPIDIVGVDAVLATGEVPHVVYKRASGGSLAVLHQSGSADPAGGWGTATDPEAALGPIAFAGTSAGSLALHLDASGAVVLWDQPATTGSADFDLFAATRPPGGAFAAALNVTGTAADTRLNTVIRPSTGMFATFLEGPSTGSRELFSVSYSASFGAPSLLSASPITDSHGDGEPGRTSVAASPAGPAHVLYREHTGSTTHDLFHVTR